MKTTCVWLAALTLAPMAGAQIFDGFNWHETREIRTAFAGSLDVDASPVGAISVHGWDETGILIRAKISADSMDIAAQVAVTESGGVVRATGPVDSNNGRHWAVGYEIFLPRTADLTLKTDVGAIAIDGIAGKIRCGASVGALQLTSLAGDVECATSVGAVSAVLAGDHWDGAQLNVQTNVGAIDLAVPKNYSAHLELSTGLGSVVSSFRYRW